MSPSVAIALRQVIAVAVGLSIEMTREALVPGLAPLIALALINAPGPALSIGKGIGLFVMVSAIAVGVLTLSAVSLATPGVYAIAVALLYGWAFFLCFTPKTAALGRLFLMMAVSVSALAAGSGLLAAVIVQDMISSIAVGVGLVLVAQALTPFTPLATAPAAAPRGPDLTIASRALIATAIMMPLHLYLTFDGFAAIVILLTAATMLTETGWGRFKAYGAVFAGGNVIGGLLALVVAMIIVAQPAFAVFLATVAAGAVVIAYLQRRWARLAPVFVTAASAFALLLGMTLSPLATSNDVAVAARVSQILVAIGYVLGATSLALAAIEFTRLKRNGSSAATAVSP